MHKYQYKDKSSWPNIIIYMFVQPLAVKYHYNYKNSQDREPQQIQIDSNLKRGNDILDICGRTFQFGNWKFVVTHLSLQWSQSELLKLQDTPHSKKILTREGRKQDILTDIFTISMYI